MTDALLARALELLSADVLAVAGFMAVGLVWSIAWTAWRKPALRRARRSAALRRARIRLEAFAAATTVSAALLALYLDGDAAAQLVLTSTLAPLSGLLSPLAYDLWWRGVRPRLGRWRDGGRP